MVGPEAQLIISQHAQALADAEEAVVAAAVGFLTAVARRGLLAKRWLLTAVSQVSKQALLRHPSTRCVRVSVASE